MIIAPATPHASSYCCDQCGQDRAFPSTEFIKGNPGDCLYFSDGTTAELWEDEREACRDGDVWSCVKYGLLSRIQHIASCCIKVPLEVLFSCCCFTTYALMAPVRVCYFGSKLCSLGVLSSDEEARLQPGHRHCFFEGVVNAVKACYATVNFPCHVLCPEAESFCYVHQAFAWIEKKQDAGRTGFFQ